MTERLEEVIERYGLITEVQNGFRSDRSCMAAITTLNMLMARRTKEEKAPFYVAYIDISKAFDTVDHGRMWEILEKTGITGTWLQNLKELYRKNVLSSITSYGKTEKIQMNRGIRQGCPLSPLLFALYANPIAIAMEQINMRKGNEPALLMYADDMVVWGWTEQELTQKLQVAENMMAKLGLQMSIEKTEIQHNKWVPPNQSSSISIKASEGQRTITYQPMDKPLRYLGAWTTANMETEKGLQLLREKMKERLDRIRGLKTNPCTKVQLLRSKIVSVWNYTAAVQHMPKEEIEEWEKKFYEAITTGDFYRQRKEQVYEKKERGGFGMTKLSEEYEKNRLRTITQIMEAGERMKGRNQVPWAQKLLLEELNKEKSGLEVINEIKELIRKTGLQITNTGTQYKKWHMQAQREELREHWRETQTHWHHNWAR
jgi:hypothetical protein